MPGAFAESGAASILAHWPGRKAFLADENADCPRPGTLGTMRKPSGWPEDHLMSDAEHQKPALLGKVIAKAWRDPAFKAKLLADPKAVLNEAGVTFPTDVTVRVVEDTAAHVHLVVPPKPTGALSEEALDHVA